MVSSAVESCTVRQDSTSHDKRASLNLSLMEAADATVQYCVPAVPSILSSFSDPIRGLSPYRLELCLPSGESSLKVLTCASSRSFCSFSSVLRVLCSVLRVFSSVLRILGAMSEPGASADLSERSAHECKRKEGYTSIYKAEHSEWQIIYRGKKPTDGGMRIAIETARRNPRSRLKSFEWDDDQARVSFEVPVSGANARRQVVRLLKAALTGKLADDFDHADLELVVDEGVEGSRKIPKLASVASSATEATGSVAASSVFSSTAVGSVAGAPFLSNNAVVEDAAAVQLRFRVLELLSRPSVENWVPRPGLEHASGTFGSVSWAFHPRLQRDVAIKTLGDASASAQGNIHFLQELEGLIAARGHPCLIQILDVVCTSSTAIGFVFSRLGPSLDKLMDTYPLKKQIKGKRGADPWPFTLPVFREAFAGLWSGLVFLAGRRLAHSDIKPANICVATQEAPWEKFVLCDFGNASLRTDGCHFVWPRRLTEKAEGVKVCTLPYRAPELLFGMADYGLSIDVWSLGVVMVEAAGNEPLFHKLQSEGALRQHLRDHGDTTGDLSTLKALPWGTEKDWIRRGGALVPEKALKFLGERGDMLVRGVLRLDPATRLTAQAALAHPFFHPSLELMVFFSSDAAAAASEGFAAAAPKEGPHPTVLQGARGECQLAWGRLDKDVLAALRGDPYWSQDWDRDWDAPCGTRNAKDRARMKKELPEVGSCASKAREREYCKIQLCGHAGKFLRQSCCDMSCDQPFPVVAATAWLEAFKTANEPVWKWLDDAFHKGPMSKFSGQDLGENGKEILSLSSRDWFGNVPSLQLSQLWQHKENQHFDGGAAIILLVVTLDGHRALQFFTETGETQAIELGPGAVYLTSACGICHQVGYDGVKVQGRKLPDLGEVGISIAWRTCLFRRSPYTAVRPGPEAVWREFNRVLRAMHSKFTFALPSMRQYQTAVPGAAQAVCAKPVPSKTS